MLKNNLNYINKPVSKNAGDRPAFLEKYLAKPSSDPLSGAFDHKFVVHPGLGSRPLPQSRNGEAYASILDTPLSGPLSIYIHVPFCQSSCLYCGFAGQKLEEGLEEAYVDALVGEIRMVSSRPMAKSPVLAVYLGGGTPSCFSPESLGKVLETVRESFTLCNDAEITLEGRVHDFTPERAQAFAEAGFNRFSLGIQSFSTDIRRRLGRWSDQRQIVGLLESLVGQGRATTVIDLIFGLPGQSPDDLLLDLEISDELKIDGLDLYQLNIFNDSPLKKSIEADLLPPAAFLNEQGEFYRAGSEYLINRQWRQLTLGHFASGFRERCLYNVMNKRKANCLGFGAGAGGHLGGWSTYRLAKVGAFLEESRSGRFIPSFLAPPSPGHEISGRIVEQMERGRLNFSELLGDLNCDPSPIRLLLDNWSDSGLITMGQNSFDLTMSGRFWGVNLTEALTKVVECSMIL
jgi:oxygen-independent coproporphyrinogen-3 oxidase